MCTLLPVYVTSQGVRFLGILISFRSYLEYMFHLLGDIHKIIVLSYYKYGNAFSLNMCTYVIKMFALNERSEGV